VIRLGIAGVIHGVEIDTSYFTGNYPPQASIDACVSDDDVPAGGWTTILDTVDLQGDAHHFVDIESNKAWTHVRLNIYPDGGVARLRIYGEIRREFGTLAGPVDLVALENGGRAIACSDEHYGSMHNLNVAGRGVNMGDGWETARRRGPGNDWVILQLGHPGRIEKAEIDTVHFKGNYPDRVSLEAALFHEAADATNHSDSWQVLLPESKVEADKQHVFDALEDIGPVSHVRLSIYPDGGVSRIRLHGHIEPGLGQ